MDGITCLYVGKTIDMKKREYTHRLKHSSNSNSKYIPDNIQWTMELIEECDNSIGHLREQYWYDTLQPLYNYQRPGNTLKESVEQYHKNHKEEIKQYRQKYKEENKERIRSYMKTYLKAYYIKKLAEKNTVS